MLRLIVLMSTLLLLSASALAVEVTIDGEPVDLPVCGGAANLQCNGDQWCDFPSEKACGKDDFFGTCRLRPPACVQIYSPVCGCDGRTYSNGCAAKASGVDAVSAGACGSN